MYFFHYFIMKILYYTNGLRKRLDVHYGNGSSKIPMMEFYPRHYAQHCLLQTTKSKLRIEVKTTFSTTISWFLPFCYLLDKLYYLLNRHDYQLHFWYLFLCCYQRLSFYFQCYLKVSVPCAEVDENIIYLETWKCNQFLFK